MKRLFNAAKAGHAGTLDPLASGLLPIALGEATKTVSCAMEGRKTYRFLIQWGEDRTTDDREGEVSALSDRRPSHVDIDRALSRFEGEISQIPPAFSAIKVEGERAYDLARAGEAVDLAPRRVYIDKLELLSLPDARSRRVSRSTAAKAPISARSPATWAAALGCRRACGERSGGSPWGHLAKRT